MKILFFLQLYIMETSVYNLNCHQIQVAEAESKNIIIPHIDCYY